MNLSQGHEEQRGEINKDKRIKGIKYFSYLRESVFICG